MQTPAGDAGVVGAEAEVIAAPESYLPIRGAAGISRKVAWTLAMVALQ